MIKRILIFATMFVLFSGLISAQALETTNIYPPVSKSEETKGVVELRYSTDNMDGAIGTTQSGPINYSAAVKFPVDQMAKYIGYNLTKVKLSIGRPTPELAGTKIWLASSVTGERLFEQDFEAVGNMWNEVVLSTPYKISSGELFIGYDISINGPGSPLGYSTNDQVANAGYVCIRGAWTTLIENNIKGNFCIVGVVEGEFANIMDAKLKSIDIRQNYMETGSEVVVCGTVVNEGNNNITSFDINYSVNGSEDLVLNISGVNVSPGREFGFKFPDKLKLDTSGYKNIKMTIKSVNGVAVGDNDDNSLTKRIFVYDKSYKGKLLMEQFTTEPCVFCPAGADFLKKFVRGNKDIVWVSHHAGYKTDSFTLDADLDLLPLFGAKTFAPAVMFGRAGDPPVKDLDYVYEEVFEEALAIPSFISLNLAGSFDAYSGTLKLDVSGDVIHVLNDELRLSIYVVEDSIKKSGQAGFSGKYTHNNVCRQAVTGSWGEPIGLKDGESFSRSYTTVLDAVWDPENVRIVAFINNYNSNDITDCEVYSVEQANLLKLKPLSSTINQDESIFRVYPNPAKDILRVEGAYDELRITDIRGGVIKMVPEQSIIDVSDLDSGIYFISIVSANKCETKKIMIAR